MCNCSSEIMFPKVKISSITKHWGLQNIQSYVSLSQVCQETSYTEIIILKRHWRSTICNMQRSQLNEPVSIRAYVPWRPCIKKFRQGSHRGPKQCQPGSKCVFKRYCSTHSPAIQEKHKIISGPSAMSHFIRSWKVYWPRHNVKKLFGSEKLQVLSHLHQPPQQL